MVPPLEAHRRRGIAVERIEDRLDNMNQIVA
jgi:hypothetical protein